MVDSVALSAAVAAVCPIDGLSIGDPSDHSTWIVHCLASATAAQQQAAQQVIAAWVDPAAIATVGGDAVLGALSDAQASASRLLDIARIASNDAVPVTNPKLARIAKAIGTTPAALFAAAQGA